MKADSPKKQWTEAFKRMRELMPPPNPLLPKSAYSSLDEPAWPGGGIRFITLDWFCGNDQAGDMNDDDAIVEKVEFNLADMMGYADPDSNQSIVY